MTPRAVACALALVSVLGVHPGFRLAAQPVEFSRDIRPILSDKCYTCHGPDSANRNIKLRLDSESGALADLGGHRAIVPGNTAASELVRRITAENKAVRMPPAYSGVTLTDREIGLLRRWIEQGARWQKHWSFIPPRRANLPASKQAQWPRNAIDHFVLARLEREHLAPSPEADRATLIRRVTLDLTGLPPTPEEIDAFLAGRSPDAYEKVVDRLLASARYGERMAAPWLDAARYADTNGYQTDAERIMWRWRDWAIASFNRNQPYDRFILEQIAGDLLPNPTLDQKIATGFSRNHRANSEGGIIPEEYLVEYSVDRVETMSTVFLGLTVGCARCHNHKYDPFTQKEFYQLFGYFNNIPEMGRVFKYGNSPPLIQAPTPEQQAHLKALGEELTGAQRRYESLQPELRRLQQAWEKTLTKVNAPDWSFTDSQLIELPLDGSTLAKVRDGDPRFGPGRIGEAAEFDGRRFLDAGNLAVYGFYDKFTLAAWIKPSTPGGAIVTRAQDISEGEGYGLYLKDGKLQANFVKRWLDDAVRVETESPLPPGWHHVAVTYD
ncbi:MAG: DUF1549 domain-containing protein, partial [Bryobacteraceae bacterium]